MAPGVYLVSVPEAHFSEVAPAIPDNASRFREGGLRDTVSRCYCAAIPVARTSNHGDFADDFGLDGSF